LEKACWPKKVENNKHGAKIYGYHLDLRLFIYQKSVFFRLPQEQITMKFYIILWNCRQNVVDDNSFGLEYILYEDGVDSTQEIFFSGEDAHQSKGANSTNIYNANANKMIGISAKFILQQTQSNPNHHDGTPNQIVIHSYDANIQIGEFVVLFENGICPNHWAPIEDNPHAAMIVYFTGKNDKFNLDFQEYIEPINEYYYYNLLVEKENCIFTKGHGY